MANVINSLKLGDGTYVFTTPYATCDTPSTTVEKVATITPGSNFSLETGARVAVKFTHANATSAPKLNVNSTGAKSIYFKNATITSSLNFWSDGQIVEFIYDGTNWNYSAAVSNTDTKDTTGSSNTSSKIFLVGATSQASSSTTYSHDTAYVGTDGCLYSNSQKVATLGDNNSFTGLNIFKKNSTDGNTDYIIKLDNSSTTPNIVLGSAPVGTTSPAVYTKYGESAISKISASGKLDFKFPEVQGGIYNISLPLKSGTVALTSDIPSISNKFDDRVEIWDTTYSGDKYVSIEASGSGSICVHNDDEGALLELNFPDIDLNAGTSTYTIATTNDVNNILTDSNTYTGITTFNTTTYFKSGVTATSPSNTSNYAWYKYDSIERHTNNTTYALTLPTKSGTIALTSDIPSGGGSGDVTAAGNNIFTGTNHFQGGNTYFQTASGGPNDPMTTVDANGVLCKTSSDPGTYYKDTEIKHKNFTLTLPFKSGVLATTDDIPSTSSFVTTDTEQTISGIKTFTGGIVVSSTLLNKTTKVSYNSNAIAYTPYGETNSKLISFPAKGGTFALTSDIPIKTATLSGTTLSITLS